MSELLTLENSQGTYGLQNITGKAVYDHLFLL